MYVTHRAPGRPNLITEAEAAGEVFTAGFSMLMNSTKPSLTLVANPVAGRGRVADRIDSIKDRFFRKGFEVETLFTSGNGDHEKLTLPLNSSSSVVAVGGDGTVNTVLHTILSTSGTRGAHELPAIGVIPFGTGNAMIPAFGIPNSLDEAVETITSQHTREVDVGLVSRNGIINKVLLLWLGAGFDGVLMHTVSETRSGPLGLRGLFGRIPLAFTRVLRYPFHEIKVTLDDQPAFTCRSAMIANVGPLPLTANVAPFADASDGLFDVITTSNVRLGAWFRMSLAALRHRLDRVEGVNYLRARRVKLQAEGRVPVHIDGDAAGNLPLEVQIKPKAIRLIVPSTS